MLAFLVIAHLVALTKSQMEEFVSDFPYAAFVNVQCMFHAPKPTVSWRCGSSIVHQYLILTAAHCVDSRMCDEISIGVTVGHAERVKGNYYPVHSYIVHEDYKPKFQANIALVRLISPVVLGAAVSRVELMANPPDEEMAEIVGWKQMLPTIEELTNDHNYSTHYVWKKQDCIGIMDDLPNGTFCASGNNSGYVLNGDTGSPLIVHGNIQIGISSYIEPKNQNTTFIFTDVVYYYEWIRDMTFTILCENLDKERCLEFITSETIIDADDKVRMFVTESNL